MIANNERVVLNWHCLDHVVARCPQCHEDLNGSQIAADLLTGRSEFCPACRTDLTDTLRLHILGCGVIRATLRELVEAGQERIEASRMIRKRSEELKTRSEILAAESQALVARVLAGFGAR